MGVEESPSVANGLVTRKGFTELELSKDSNDLNLGKASIEFIVFLIMNQ